MDDVRIPMRGGDEFDALAKAKRHHKWRAGQRARVKRGYWRRFRHVLRRALKQRIDD